MNELKHVALIMDGNGRWAKKRNKPRIFGHNEGIKTIKEIVEEAIKQKINHISFFAFSTENWDRDEIEVNFLLNLFNNFLTNKNLEKLNEKKIRANWIGFEDKMPKQLLKKIYLFQEKTLNNSVINVNIFFNYSGTKDIENAFKFKDNNSKDIKKYLLTKNLPPIDLLIRTSGEQRISNFALYDLAYSEIIFEKTLWPDYKCEIFKENINEYYTRDRRFGKINDEQ